MRRDLLELGCDLAQLEDYLFCSMRFYLLHVARRAGQAESDATASLPGKMLRRGLELWFAARSDPDLRRCVLSAWALWLGEAGLGDDVFQALLAVERPYLELSAKFLEEHRYWKEDPRASSQFVKVLRAGGVTDIAARIDEQVAGRGRAIISDLASPRIGPYYLAYAFVDSLRMASSLPLPPRQSVLGVGVPCAVEVGQFRVKATADIVVRDGEEIIVHVLDTLPWRHEETRIGRDLRVIAAMNMKFDDSGVQQGVSGVSFVTAVEGRPVIRKLVRPLRLSIVIAWAVRGIQAGVYVPQFLTDSLRCSFCSLEPVCLGKDDLLEYSLPASDIWGEAAVEALDALRELPDERRNAVRDLAGLITRQGILPVDLAALLAVSDGAGLSS
jgi:hypothetical protein